MKKLFPILTMALTASILFTGCTGTQAGSVSPQPSDAGTPTAESSSQPSASSFDTSKDITVVSREDGSGTRGAFIELTGIEEKDANGNKTDHTTLDAIIANKTDVMLTQVSGNEYAIGYVSVGSLNDAVKALSIDGAQPTTDNIKSGAYKIARPFNIATKGTPSALAQDFIGFILSKEGQEVVAKSYISVNESAAAYAGTKPEGKLVIAGSSSVTPVMEKLKEAYALVNPGATLEIQQSDSTSGMQSTIDGICDIGMASRELKDSEKEKLTATQIAIDGIAVIVHPENSTADLSSETVKQIFTGETTKWSDVK